MVPDEYPFIPTLNDKLVVALLQAQGAPVNVQYIAQPLSGPYSGVRRQLRFTGNNAVSVDVSLDYLEGPFAAIFIGITLTSMLEAGVIEKIVPLPAVVAPTPAQVNTGMPTPKPGQTATPFGPSGPAS